MLSTFIYFGSKCYFSLKGEDQTGSKCRENLQHIRTMFFNMWKQFISGRNVAN